MSLRVNRLAVSGILVFMLVLPGCAGLGQRLETPDVKIDSLRMLPSQGLSQRFSMGLLLSNPNPVALPVAGIRYSVSLNGYDVLSGVSAEIPTLGAYSETKVTLEGSADVVAAVRLVNSMATRPQDKLRYELTARLDLQGWRPSLNISEAGLIDLRAATAR